MTLSPMVAEWAIAYEQEHGQKPTEPVLRIVEHIENVGGMLTNLGRTDAQEHKEAYSLKDFRALAAKAFHLDPERDYEKVQAIAELWQSDYMSGYQKGGAV